MEGTNNACYIQYGSERINNELVSLSEPILELGTTEKWISFFQMPISYFDKVLCTEIEKPSNFIENVLVQLNTATEYRISGRKCDIELIKNGEAIFKLENPELKALAINFDDSQFSELILKTVQQKFKAGKFERATEFNSIVHISIELKNRNVVWFVYILTGALTMNIVFTSLEILKFILKGPKSFLK